MKARVYFLLFVLLTCIFTSKAQITNDLQNAINEVPVVSFSFPANRNRNRTLQVQAPQAYVYAYYKLPYAINLGAKTDEVTGESIESVILKFYSVDLAPSQERRIIVNAILELQNLLDRQNKTARIAGYDANTNYSRSMLSRIFSNGRAIAAYREIITTQDLINQLIKRSKII